MLSHHRQSAIQSHAWKAPSSLSSSSSTSNRFAEATRRTALQFDYDELEHYRDRFGQEIRQLAPGPDEQKTPLSRAVES
ncbi:MAG: hypothetical protein AB1705_07840 [Verrucomicrobiota bacterium]